MFYRTPFFLPVLYPSLVWRVHTKQKYLYLTFDDGPVPGPTEFVLETLKKFNVKATFFCIGDNIERHPVVFRNIIIDGHTIGNHTFNHLNGWATAKSLYVDNVNRCSESIHECTIAGHGTKHKPLFRPPYGRITREQISALLPNYQIIMWDVLSCDFRKNISQESCLRNTIGASRQGSIVIFHDSFKAEKNLTFALPRFIDHFLKKGFQFKTLITCEP